MHRTAVASLLLLLATGSGCITVAQEELPAIQPVAPSAPGTLEETVGDYVFTLDGGKMVTNNKAGRMLNDKILAHWQERGYIARHAYVPSSQFTGKADYNLTLSGSEHGKSSFGRMLLSSLTLYVIPYTIDGRFDVQYTIENVKTGAKYSAGTADGYTQWNQLLLVFALPFWNVGEVRTAERMADHLYEQLRAQGAFGP